GRARERALRERVQVVAELLRLAGRQRRQLGACRNAGRERPRPTAAAAAASDRTENNDRADHLTPTACAEIHANRLPVNGYVPAQLRQNRGFSKVSNLTARAPARRLCDTVAGLSHNQERAMRISNTTLSLLSASLF